MAGRRFLEVRDLHAWYGESHVLHGVNLHVDEGEVVTLLGRNGAGRTILMGEHHMSVVSRIADTITVLARGATLAEGPYAEVSKNPAVIEAYMGSADAELKGAH
jgi:branched-chain amino acid transport system ATP-binding protein